jgi:hypothetical protein
MIRSFSNRCPAFLMVFFSSLASCTVYYTTQEVDNSLKSTVDQVDGYISKAVVQVEQLKSQYNEITCDRKPEAMAQADQMLLVLEGQMMQIERLQNKVNHEYQVFKSETKGKEKIQSGTPQWKQMKLTKKNLKDIVKELEGLGESVVMTATEFNQYVTSTVIPAIQYCDVNAYVIELDQAMKSLQHSQKEANEGLKRYQGKIAAITRQFGPTEPIKCKELNGHLSALKAHVAEIDLVVQNVQNAIDLFKKNTGEFKKLYSCNSNWMHVSKVQEEMKNQQQQLAMINLNLQAKGAEIQSIINSLGQ